MGFVTSLCLITFILESKHLLLQDVVVVVVVTYCGPLMSIAIAIACYRTGIVRMLLLIFAISKEWLSLIAELHCVSSQIYIFVLTY